MAPSIVAVVGKSNSGKTTLVEKITAILSQKGYIIGTAKHTHCGFDLDRKGKDTWRHRKAGAGATLMITDGEAILVKTDSQAPKDKMRMYLTGMDLVIAEGFKGQDLPKIEIFRAQSGHRLPLFMDPQFPVSKNLIAFVTDSDYDTTDVPVFDIDDAQGVAAFIESQFLSG